MLKLEQEPPQKWGDTLEEVRGALAEKALSSMEFRHRFFDFLVDFKGSATTWSSTPLGDSGAIRANQREVFDILMARTHGEAVGSVPSYLRPHLQLNVMARFHERAADNKYSYSTRMLETHPSVNGYQVFSEYGEATPYQNSLVGRVLQMKSIEYARLTHENGYGIENLDPMRVAVAAALYATGAVQAEANETLEVLQSDTASTLSPATDNSILMKRERLLATYPDQTRVKERSTFILRIDEESGFDQDLATKIRQANTAVPTWAGRVLRVGKLERVVPPLLNENNYMAAIPIATTIWGYNPITAGLIELQRQTQASDGNPAERRIRALAQASLGQEHPMLFIESSL